MSIRALLILLVAGLFATGCVSPTICDPDEAEPYMDARTGKRLDREGAGAESDRYQVPGEEEVDRSSANPCLARAPRIIDAPQKPEWEEREGQAFADLRYRLEVVDEDAFDEQAQASTMRLRLGGTTPSARGFDAGVAFQTTRVVGEPRYEDTTGSPGRFPTVRDPEDTIASEGWGRFRSREGVFQFKIGRQPLSHDNERFIGTDSFRQLEQTFNAAATRFGTGETARADIQYITQANRVVGPNHPDPMQATSKLEALVFDYDQAIGDTRLGVYAHEMEFKDDSPSHRNLGIRLKGRLPWTERFSYRMEYARQEGINDEGPPDELGYRHLRLAQDLEGWSWELGSERLEGDRQWAVQTPLASLHRHNGWADRFLVTPAFGLVDHYVGVNFEQGEWDFGSRVHDFHLDDGSGRYGQELSLSAGRDIFGPVRLQFGLSHYAGEEENFYPGDEFEGDRTRAWFSLTARFEP